MNNIKILPHDKLLKEYETAKLRLALESLRQDDIKKFSEPCEDDAIILKSMQKNKAEFMQRLNRGYKRPERMSAPRALKKAALSFCVIITVITLGLGTAFAVSENFRVNMYKMMAKTTDEYTQISLSKENMSVPNGWGGDYFPSYIPEGFEIKQMSPLEFNFILYVNNKGEKFNFFEFPNDSVTNVDSENAKVTNSTIHDNPALVIEKDGLCTITWSEFDRYFIVDFNGSAEETMRIAKSVQRIK